ncbi:short-chain dehydrogenase [Shewanella halifaxensis]
MQEIASTVRSIIENDHVNGWVNGRVFEVDGGIRL